MFLSIFCLLGLCVTISVLSIVDLSELFYFILPMLHDVWPTNSLVNKEPLQLSQFRSWSVLTVDLRYKVRIPLFYPAANLAANLVFDQICSQVFDKFVRVCDTLSTSFRLFCRTAAGSMVRARARQMECRKNPF